MSGTLVAAALVPGLPHLLARQPAKGWTQLADAMTSLGEAFRAARVDTLMIVSTQWVSVLGLQVQTRAELTGTRVDENWYSYDYGTIAFALQTDVALSEQWLRELRQEGFQARPTSHPHFPVDTGLVVATRLLDPQGAFKVAQVSLNLYGTPQSVEKVGEAAARAARAMQATGVGVGVGSGTGTGTERQGASAQADGRRVAMLAIGGLSSHPHRTWINPERDSIATPADEHSNRRVLELLAQGKADALFAAREGLVAKAAMDGQLRTLSFLHGAVDLQKPAEVMAYAPVWGMGAAVVRWPLG